MKKLNWIAFFSQTGSELFQIVQAIQCIPDIVVIHTNQRQRIVPGLLECLEKNGCTIIEFSKKPVLAEYTALPRRDTITLHGWLRIIPAEYCESNNIFNGHPGDIIRYPELKGKDPQAKAFSLKHKTVGTVIHKVTPIVDDGEIIASDRIDNTFSSIDDVINNLKVLSIKLWVQLLSTQFKLE